MQFFRFSVVPTTAAELEEAANELRMRAKFKVCLYVKKADPDRECFSVRFSPTDDADTAAAEGSFRRALESFLIEE